MRTARIWREIPQRYRLEAAACKACGKVHYPPRRVCDACGGREFEATSLPLRGVVKSFTHIQNAATSFTNQIPLIMGIIELENGVRITTQIADVEIEDLRADLPVRLEFRKIQQDGVSGVISYGHKAVPA